MSKKEEVAEKLSLIQVNFISDVIKVADEYGLNRVNLVELSIAMMESTSMKCDFEHWGSKDE